MWANVSLHSAHVYVQYVCVCKCVRAGECVFQMHNNVFSLLVSPW